MNSANGDNFDEMVATGTVLVDFWTEWCAPCKASMPHLETFATENPDIKVVKADADELSDLAEKFNVRTVPTFILFKDGVEVKRHVGSATKAILSKLCS